MAAKRYAITFTPGLEQPVAELLTRSGAQQVRISGAMATFVKAGRVEAPYASQVFAIAEESRAQSGKAWLSYLLSRRAWLDRLPGLLPRTGTFRIIINEEGRLVKTDPKLLARMEDLVAEATGLASDRARPGVELWAMVRQDGAAYFLVRLSRLSPEKKDLPPGALKPDFCALIASLSGIERGQIALDPFAGHGGIARALHSLGAQVICGDKDADLVRKLSYWAKNTKRVKAECWDALALPIESGTVNAIVTDPPWGEFSPLPQPPDVYMARVTAEFTRVLHPSGTLVLVTSLKTPTRSALAAHGLYPAEYPVLVNGKKASVFVASRR